MYENIQRIAEEAGCLCTRNAPLSGYTTFKIGGPASLLIEPASVDSLSKVLRACSAEGVTPLVLGRGSNVLAPDEEIGRAHV